MGRQLGWRSNKPRVGGRIISANIRPEVADGLEAIARQKNSNMSKVVREVVTKYVNEQNGRSANSVDG